MPQDPSQQEPETTTMQDPPEPPPLEEGNIRLTVEDDEWGTICVIDGPPWWLAVVVDAVRKSNFVVTDSSDEYIPLPPLPDRGA